ncbi:MAG TPA: DUF1553 domain-containing protein [Pirellulaceae bacterium]|nr:DUF1553 domain-containing protein [Pirellulaceae bacterium]
MRRSCSPRQAVAQRIRSAVSALASAPTITTVLNVLNVVAACIVAAACANSVVAAEGPPSTGRRFNFETDIVPILNKFGCNTSGCHGKAEGQNGFKLSVFGSDPDTDYRALTMEGRGRRVFPSAPDHSLLLRKMSGLAPHGGGVRIEPGKVEYNVLRDWIAAGMPRGSADDPQVVSIRLSPREQTLTMRQSVPLKVTARWSDERETDVTTLANFQSNNESLVRVDGAGLVTAGDLPGSGAVMANYLGHVDLFQALVPRRESLDAYPNQTQHNFIDRLVDDRLRKLKIIPAPLAGDAEFMRRAYLDVIGALPTSDEARRFLADTRPDRRARLVDELLQRPEFSDLWALRWADLLRVDREVLGHKNAYESYRWIRDSIANRKPLDQFAREILTAEGPLSEAPQGNLFKAITQPGEAASTVSQVFLGVRIACAQCHHHPFDRWSQDDYFGMTAFFTQLQRKNSPLGELLVAEGNPSTTHPRTNRVVHAHALGVAEPEKSPEGDRRRVLAAWLAAPDNPFFARNLANRVWAHFLGRGLVEPVDDFRETNPPSNPELLDALAQDLVAKKFDLRELVRTITASRVYQQSTQTNPTNVDDEQNYSRALLKRLDAETLLDAVSDATGVPEKFEGIASGSRAVQLWDSRVDHYFLSLFGRPARKTACECERNASPSVAQVLHLLNSDRVHVKLTHDAGRVAKLVRTQPSDRELVEELYLSFLSRPPREEERRAAIAHLASAPDRRAAAEDLAWSLLNTLEFVFNH